MSTAAAEMVSLGGHRIALRGMHIEATLRDLVSEITVTQTYKNLEDINIEAVYTFPLPLDAVLLELRVSLGERELKGVVVEKKEAEERYEEAITDGDTAIMLEQAEPGLYTMNVGNLQAGEIATVRFTYSMLHHWQGNSLRFMLPTTIAPRYGDPLVAMQPHQTPEHSLHGGPGFSVNVAVEGVLRNARVSSPSHRIGVASEGDRTVVALISGNVAMDRDFVLNFEAGATTSSSVRCGRDIDGYVALATFHPDLGDYVDAAPRSYKIVVDCSGSMGGDSIAQAREALRRIIDSLRPRDFFNIIKFGNHVDRVFDGQKAASPENLDIARRYIGEVDADMGGTEIGAALAAAYASPCAGDIRQDVLLITDGEVWDSETVHRAAAGSGHRIFTVGVGSSVAEAFVRRLARETGGACELVSPGEGMASKIHRHFTRMTAPAASDVSVSWPGEPLRRFPEAIGPVYAGDTVHLYAWYAGKPPAGEVALSVTMAGGSVVHAAKLDTSAFPKKAGKGPSALARIAAATLLGGETNAAEGAALSVRYQLLSRWANYLVIAMREDKAEDLPELRKVPQTLAAGWGGAASVDWMGAPAACADLDLAMAPPAPAPASERVLHKSRRAPAERVKASLGSSPPPMESCADEPVDLIEPLTPDLPAADFEELIDFVKSAGARWLAKGEIDVNTSWWTERLPGPLNDVVKELVTAGHERKTVVLSLLNLLARSSASERLSRDLSRLIKKAYKDVNPDPGIEKRLRDALLTLSQWEVLAG